MTNVISDFEFLKSLSNESVLFAGLLGFGRILKGSPISDWLIPHVIGFTGVVSYQLMAGSGARNAMIGLSISSMAVFGHQVVKQWKDARASGDTDHFTKPKSAPTISDPPADEPLVRNERDHL